MNHARPPFFWGVALTAGLILLGYLYVGFVVVRYGGRSVEFGWESARSEGEWRVSRVAEEGPADERLRPGDVVLAVNGHPDAARLGPFYDISGYEVGLRFVW